MNGPHALLREGAKLVETAADFFEEFGVAAPRFGEKVVQVVTSAQREPLLEYIDYARPSIDYIVKRSGLTATIVSSMLIRLEFTRAGSMWRWRVSLRTRTAPAKSSRTHGDVITVHRASECVMIFPATK